MQEFDLDLKEPANNHTSLPDAVSEAHETQNWDDDEDQDMAPEQDQSSEDKKHYEEFMRKRLMHYNMKVALQAQPYEDEDEEEEELQDQDFKDFRSRPV